MAEVEGGAQNDKANWMMIDWKSFYQNPVTNWKRDAVFMGLITSLAMFVLLMLDCAFQNTELADDWRQSLKDHKMFKARQARPTAAVAFIETKTAYEYASSAIFTASLVSFSVVSIGVPLACMLIDVFMCNQECSIDAVGNRFRGAFKAMVADIETRTMLTLDWRSADFMKSWLLFVIFWVLIAAHGLARKDDFFDDTATYEDGLYQCSIFFNYGLLWVGLVFVLDLISWGLHPFDKLSKDAITVASSQECFRPRDWLYWVFLATVFFEVLRPGSWFGKQVENDDSPRYCNFPSVNGSGFYVNTAKEAPYPSEHIVSDATLILWLLCVHAIVLAVLSSAHELFCFKFSGFLEWALERKCEHVMVETPKDAKEWLCRYFIVVVHVVWLVAAIADMKLFETGIDTLMGCADVAGSSVTELFWAANAALLFMLIFRGSVKMEAVATGNATPTPPAPTQQAPTLPNEEGIIRDGFSDFRLSFVPAPSDGPSIRCPLKRSGEDEFYANAI